MNILTSAASPRSANCMPKSEVFSNRAHHSHGAHGPGVLNEALVEVPHLFLDMIHLHDTAPAVADVAHAALAGLATVRAVQCFRLPGWEAKLEGISATALAVSGAASLIPGGLGHTVAEGAHVGHGVLEFGLGANETWEALSQDEKDWRSLANGALGMVKGLAVLTPMVAPALEHVSHLVELGALVGRAGLEFAPSFSE